VARLVSDKQTCHRLFAFIGLVGNIEIPLIAINMIPFPPFGNSVEVTPPGRSPGKPETLQKSKNIIEFDGPD